MQAKTTGHAHTPAGSNKSQQTADSATGAAKPGALTSAEARASLVELLAQDDAQDVPTETRQQSDGDTPDTATEESAPSGETDQTEAQTEAEAHPEQPAAEAEADREDNAETDLSTTETETDGESREDLPKGVAKRIGKLQKQHREEIAARESELNQIRQELETLKSKAGNPEPGAADAPTQNPFTDIKDVRQLDKAKLQLQDFMDWAEENPDGGQYGGRELDHDAVKTARRNARRALAVHLPAQERWLNDYASAHAQVKAALPWIEDRKHPDHAEVQMVIQAMPWIKQRADYEYWSAAMVRGHKAIQAELAERAKPKPKPVTNPTPPPAPKAPAASPARTDDRRARLEAAKSQALRTGTRDDLANYLTAMR